MNKIQRTIFSSISVIVAVFFASCNEKEVSEEPKQKDTLRIAYNAQPPTLDQHTSSANACRSIGRGGIFELLVTSDENYGIVNELAEKVDVSSDYKEFVFYLRKGVKFHNGKEMTADDVVSSMNRWKDYYGSAKVACGKSSFEKVDDYTVRIQLEDSSMGFLDMIAGAKQPAAIMPKEIIEEAGNRPVTKFIGTGPYKLSEWAQDQYIKLEKFDDYKPYGTKGDASGWGGYKEALTKNVIFEFVPDSSTRVNGIQTGEYDYAIDCPPDDYQMLKANDELSADTTFGGGLCVIFDKSEGWTANGSFRKAVNAALDKEAVAIAAEGLPEFFRLDPGYMYVEQKNWYTQAGKESYLVNDKNLAKKYLDEAGYDGSQITIMVSSAYSDFNNIGIALKQQLENAGISVNLMVVDWPTQQSYMKDASKYDMFVTSFTPCAAPTDLLYLQATWEGWSTDSKLQDYLTKIRTSTNPAEAKKTWEECQAYCWNDYLPAIKIADKFGYSVMTKKVSGMKFFQNPIFWNTVVYE